MKWYLDASSCTDHRAVSRGVSALERWNSSRFFSDFFADRVLLERAGGAGRAGSSIGDSS